MRLRHKLAGLAAGIACVAGIIAATVPSATAAEPASETSGCRFGHWPAGVDGQPAGFRPGATAGVYLWHDRHGWRLRVTHTGHQRVVFTGEITAAGQLHGVARHIEGGDRVVLTLSHDRSRLSFKFDNFGHVDGLDFRAACAPQLRVTAAADGHRLPPARVLLGRRRDHPGSVPFTIERTR